MLRFIVRRLLWVDPDVCRHVPRVLAIRIGTDPVASYLRANPRPARQDRSSTTRPTACTTASAVTSSSYFDWLRRLRQPATGPRSIKGSREVWPPLQARDRQLAPCSAASPPSSASPSACRSASSPRCKPRSAARHRASTPALFVGLSIPPFVVGRDPAAALRRLRSRVVRADGRSCRRRASTRRATRASTSVLRMQAPDPAGHRRRHPDHRRLQPLHAGLAARRARTATTCARPAPRASASARVLVQPRAAQRADPDRHGRRASTSARIIGGLIITESIFEYPGMGDFFLTRLRATATSRS